MTSQIIELLQDQYVAQRAQLAATWNTIDNCRKGLEDIGLGHFSDKEHARRIIVAFYDNMVSSLVHDSWEIQCNFSNPRDVRVLDRFLALAGFKIIETSSHIRKVSFDHDKLKRIGLSVI